MSAQPEPDLASDSLILGIPDLAIYLVDTSVLARASREPAVQAQLLHTSGEGILAVCTGIALEVGFTARNSAEWDAQAADLARFVILNPTAQTHDIALGIQRALWHAGKVRAAGTTDIISAALAVQYQATILHYDRDFEHIAAAEPRLKQRWVVPAGSIS